MAQEGKDVEVRLGVLEHKLDSAIRFSKWLAGAVLAFAGVDHFVLVPMAAKREFKSVEIEVQRDREAISLAALQAGTDAVSIAALHAGASDHVERLSAIVAQAEEVDAMRKEWPRMKSDLATALEELDGIRKEGALVPRGSVVAWLPGKDDFDADRKVKVPVGWQVLDQELTDVSGLFLRGVPLQDGRFQPGSGGTDRHTHKGTIGPAVGAQWNVGPEASTDAVPDVGHSHNLSLDAESHLPPYLDVVFLQKL